jgi:antitoxin HicB
MERFDYAVRLSADDGGFVVTCRDLPSLITEGNDKADALAHAVDALDEVFATYMVEGLVLPPPSEPKRGEYLIAPPAETMAKAALYLAMRDAGVTKVELARRLDVDEKEVRRLLNPHYGSKLPRIAEAIQLLGGRLVIGLETAK